MKILSTKNIYSIGLVSLVLGMLFNYLFFDKQIGISFVIYASLLLSGLFGFLKFFNITYNKSVTWFLLPILFFSIMVGILDNDFLLFWNFAITVGLLLLLSHHIVGRSIKNCLFFDYARTAVMLPLNMIGGTFSSLSKMLTVGKEIKQSQKTSQITKGIIITIPIVLFFLFLLSSADLVFNRLVSNLFSFNFNINPSVVTQIWWMVAFGLLWLGVYTYILENVSGNENIPVPPIENRFRFGNIEAGILFTTLNVLFLTFVIIQIKYLFAGHSAITQLGFTYAEYVHKGFGELVVVALLTFDLIFLAERYIERTENKASSLFKILTGGLIVLVLVIMASAFIRLTIYEQAYSFTLLRVLVQAFIIWLAAIFLWLGYKIIKNVGDRAFVFGIFLSAVAFFIIFNLLNPDAYITRKNIGQFAQTGRLDTRYLSSLSADSVPALIPLLNMSGAKDRYGNELSHEVAVALKNYHDSLTQQSWQSYNLSRNRALKLIDNNWGLIVQLAK